jgi:uncharacterized small protein (DUF1192 family)
MQALAWLSDFRVVTDGAALQDRPEVQDQEDRSMHDDDKPKKKVVHEIGQDLSLLSVFELNERIELLGAEIARLEATAKAKSAAKGAADSFFKS